MTKEKRYNRKQEAIDQRDEFYEETSERTTQSLSSRSFINRNGTIKHSKSSEQSSVYLTKLQNGNYRVVKVFNSRQENRQMDRIFTNLGEAFGCYFLFCHEKLVALI